MSKTLVPEYPWVAVKGRGWVSPISTPSSELESTREGAGKQISARIRQGVTFAVGATPKMTRSLSGRRAWPFYWMNTQLPEKTRMRYEVTFPPDWHTRKGRRSRVIQYGTVHNSERKKTSYGDWLQMYGTVTKEWVRTLCTNVKRSLRSMVLKEKGVTFTFRKACRHTLPYSSRKVQLKTLDVAHNAKVKDPGRWPGVSRTPRHLWARGMTRCTFLWVFSLPPVSQA